MIDPIHALAFSIQANRGVYALLLGSLGCSDPFFERHQVARYRLLESLGRACA